VAALVEQRRGPRNPHPNRVSPESEQIILDFCLAQGGSCTGGSAPTLLQVDYDAQHRPEQLLGNGTFNDGRRQRFRYEASGGRYLQRGLMSHQPLDAGETTLYPFAGYEVRVVRHGNGYLVQGGRQLLDDYGAWVSDGTGGRLVWRHVDRLGSPAAHSDGQGQVVERRGFDVWGAPRDGNWSARPGGKLGSGVSPRGFTGHEHLDESGGLIHMNGRLLDPALGRFYGADPIVQFPGSGQSLNPYSYLMNNPLSGTDPTGYVCKGTDSYASCGNKIEEGETAQVRSTELGSRISKVVGTVTNLGNGAIRVTAMNGRSGVITNVGNGSKNTGASAQGPTTRTVSDQTAGAPRDMGASSRRSNEDVYVNPNTVEEGDRSDYVSQIRDRIRADLRDMFGEGDSMTQSAMEADWVYDPELKEAHGRYGLNDTGPEVDSGFERRTKLIRFGPSLFDGALLIDKCLSDSCRRINSVGSAMDRRLYIALHEVGHGTRENYIFWTEHPSRRERMWGDRKHEQHASELADTYFYGLYGAR